MKIRGNETARKWTSIIAASLLLISCSGAPKKDTFAQVEVYRIDTGIANVYLIKGEKLIMVDTSVPPKLELLLEKIRELGFRPEDISLLIVTHGHADHAGNSRFFQEKYKIPVAGGEGDLDKFTGGKTDLGKAESIGITARMIRGMSDKPYPAFTPDIIIRSETSLEKYGVVGKIVPLPGHTPGSLIVTIGDVALVGDLIRGGMLFSDSPTEHFFHENRAQAKQQLIQLASTGVKTFYPGHFGPLKSKDVTSYLQD